MIVQVRHSSNTGNTPIALANGELALNAKDQLLYHKHANGAVVILANGAAILTFATAQVSSNLNQVPANTQAWRVTYNINDFLIGATHILGNSRVTVLSNGWYTVVATGNYLRTGGGGAVRFADCWLRKNNVDVIGTTTRTPVPLPNLDLPMNLRTTLRLAANDYIELIQAVDSATGATGLRGDVALAGGPAMTSVSLSITKIAN
jgi:hypothetical protein